MEVKFPLCYYLCAQISDKDYFDLNQEQINLNNNIEMIQNNIMSPKNGTLFYKRSHFGV